MDFLTDTPAEKLNIELKDLPRIKENDPAVKMISAKKLDVIKITRPNNYISYRIVKG